MKRRRSAFLIDWLHERPRKPLVIRGARQVGKTWLIRDFARSQGLELIELNFEKRPELESLFASNDPKEILLNLQTLAKGKINPSASLLFLDEIQAAPKLLAKLRWFAEDAPELPVIAAGSLLEFALAKHEFSMPVGRINYMYLEPLSFEEFIEATGRQTLGTYLEQYTWNMTIPLAIHTQLMKVIKEYVLIGGMPAAVSSWIQNHNLNKVSQVHFDLLATYRDDFAKYSGRLPVDRLEEVMAAVPRQLGNKFVFSRVNSQVPSPPLKQGLDLLVKAKVCHLVLSTAANGLPMGAEINEKYKKVVMLDCGLCGVSLGLTMQQIQSADEIILINNGAMAEQLVGQTLRTLFPPYVSPSLYYWQRRAKKANAEIDYAFQFKNEVIPIEVKAGSSGSLKSLHQFMKEKRKKLAVRVNSDYPSIAPVEVKNGSGETISYRLLSLPFYLLGQLNRLLEELSD